MAPSPTPICCLMGGAWPPHLHLYVASWGEHGPLTYAYMLPHGGSTALYVASWGEHGPICCLMGGAWPYICCLMGGAWPYMLPHGGSMALYVASWGEHGPIYVASWGEHGPICCLMPHGGSMAPSPPYSYVMVSFNMNEHCPLSLAATDSSVLHANRMVHDYLYKPGKTAMDSGTTIHGV